MNHFEFGFFDELEKIATDPRLVATMRKGINADPRFKHLGRRTKGDLINRRAQVAAGTPSQKSVPVNRGEPSYFRPINSSNPGMRVSLTPEQRAKVQSRRKDGFMGGAEHSAARQVMGASARKDWGYKPYGMGDQIAPYSQPSGSGFPAGPVQPPKLPPFATSDDVRTRPPISPNSIPYGRS